MGIGNPDLWLEIVHEPFKLSGGRASVLDGESSLPLFVEQGSPLGEIYLIQGLINIHENTSLDESLKLYESRN